MIIDQFVNRKDHSTVSVLNSPAKWNKILITSQAEGSKNTIQFIRKHEDYVVFYQRPVLKTLHIIMLFKGRKPVRLQMSSFMEMRLKYVDLIKFSVYINLCYLPLLK